MSPVELGLPRMRQSGAARGIRDIRDVAEGRLCSGCGTCAAVAPSAVRMVDDLNAGRRPVQTASADDPEVQAALRACPGASLAHGSPPAGAERSLLADWGPVLELWEGWAADPEIRFAGSSGGVATALALHMVTSGASSAVLHTAARTDAPLLNETVLSTTRDELLARAGSRYAPASPADGLAHAEADGAAVVFIGKPCDVAGAHKARADRPALDAGLALTIAVFCAGTPTTQGTVDMVKAMGFERPEDVRSVRYRGNGWPGHARAEGVRDGLPHEAELTYAESWGSILQKHRQWRCHLCLDHTGEFADIAVGDPWYREVAADDPGRSLVVVRTERGRATLAAAIAAGALLLERVDPSILPASQPNLVLTRGAVWGRRLALRSMRLPVPRYARMPSFRTWLRKLSFKQKGQSVLGTMSRARSRGLRRRAVVRES